MEITFTGLLIDPENKIIREIQLIDSMRVYKKYLQYDNIGLKELDDNFDLLFDADALLREPGPRWKFKKGNDYYRGKSILLSKPTRKTKYGNPYVDNRLSVGEANSLISLFKYKIL